MKGDGDFNLEFASPPEVDARPLFDESSRVVPARPEETKPQSGT